MPEDFLTLYARSQPAKPAVIEDRIRALAGQGLLTSEGSFWLRQFRRTSAHASRLPTNCSGGSRREGLGIEAETRANRRSP